MTHASAAVDDRRPRLPWVVLVLGLLWTVWVRIPLIVNAADHLDSDLAVDGLTLLDAVRGHWRWHYPGTPHMGIFPMFFSYLQSLIWGVNAVTLVSGGSLIWVLVVASAFGLAWKAYGPRVAAWAIVPLVFSSLGTIWLSGRITGGHLLTLVWHNLALLGLQVCWSQRGRARSAVLGLWCGLGFYLDAMFLFTLAGMAIAVLFSLFRTRPSRIGIELAAMFCVGMIVGVVPREIGRRMDPYDAYPAQFGATLDPAALQSHVRLLSFHCLPRLIAGSELYELDRTTAGQARHGSVSLDGLILLALIAFTVAIGRLGLDAVFNPTQGVRNLISRSVLGSAILIVAAFVVNRNIFNSDNYRYLIYLLTPWSLGFGLMMDSLWRRGRIGCRAAGFITGFLIAGMTVSTFYWYGEIRHYIDKRGSLVKASSPPWSDLVVRGRRNVARGERSRTFRVPADVTHVFGGYWDVYRMAFLSGKCVQGIPFPMYPNRFPGWSRGLGPDQGKLLILQPVEESNSVLRPAADTGGDRFRQVRSASGIDWRPALQTVWEQDGRDPTERDLIRVVVP